MAWFDINKLFGGSRHEKLAERFRPQVMAINALAEEMRGLSDGELKMRVAKYHDQELGDDKQGTNEIFAAAREASERTLKMRHFDVQIMGGLALLDGMIAEMKTGEGKTLVATLPLIRQGVAGQGAHLVTVNDYLALRDAEWMKPLFEFFNLSVGVVLPGQAPAEKRLNYAADITYGTNNEFGFDYLRDNMAQRMEDMVQRRLHYAIVDEVDSILIDEARTPLIISAPDQESTQLYQQFSRLVPQLEAEKDFNIDEKRRAVSLTDEGITKMEKMLGVDNLYQEKGIRFVHHLEQALRATNLYNRDKDYIVKDGQVIIVDEFTGRLMEGRRYAEGLHQAIEAKEGVRVQQESRTLATITFQNFFRLYEKLAGMTGTAVTSAEEFEKVYNLDVTVIPTNQKLIRNDKPDRIYMTEKIKFSEAAKEIKRRQEAGQPVLVGTIAIEKSEYLSALLHQEGVKHEVLNAKHHAREAEIVAKAGQAAAVTISTNMAGRGTDIKLGEGIAEKGGLLVIGTERHEAQRIDHQLRGRSGRQGDPGETQFFVSLEDDVMRIFGGSKIQGLMKKLKLPDDEPIENRMVTKAIDGAQQRVEGYYFDMRKQVLSYDDVLNKQRNAIYTLRRGILNNQSWQEYGKAARPILEFFMDLVADQSRSTVEIHTEGKDEASWNWGEIAEVTGALCGYEPGKLEEKWHAAVRSKISQGPGEAREELILSVQETWLGKMRERTQAIGEEIMKNLAAAGSLRAIDLHWMDHLDTMDYLRAGIGLRGYGQRDPLVEYQKEGYRLFNELLAKIKGTMMEITFKAEPTAHFREEAMAGERQQTKGAEAGGSLHELAAGGAGGATPFEGDRRTDKPIINEFKNVGRNDPCPCGSGKKYKKCHGV